MSVENIVSVGDVKAHHEEWLGSSTMTLQQ